MKRLHLIVALVAFAALAVVPAASPGHGPDAFTVKASKHKDGPYSIGIQFVNLDPGTKKSLYWRVANTSGTRLAMAFNDAATPLPNPPGYRLKWFRGNREITDEVQTSGFDFNLKRGKKKIFTGVLKAKASPEPFCLGGQAYKTEPPMESHGAYFGVNGDPCD